MNVGIIISIVLASLTIMGMLYRLGGKVTAIDSGMAELKKERTEDRKVTETCLDAITAHTADRQSHLDPRLEERDADWRRSVDRKLELLLQAK